MSTLLLTGASGFIGVNIVERLLGQGHAVVGLSPDGLPALAHAAMARLPGRYLDLIGDVRDAALVARLFAEHRFDAVVAAAAITAGPERERAGPASIIEVNLAGVARMLEAAEAAGVRRLVCFSSTAAVGERAFGAASVLETDRPEPLTLYGITKAALEDLAVRWNSFSPGCEMAVVRLSAAFGPWERASGVRDTLSPAWQLASAAVEGVPVAPLPAGGARDWVHAPWAARVVEWLALEPHLPSHLFNVSAGQLWHPRLMIECLAAAGLPVAESLGGREVAFHDDLNRLRVPLSAGRISLAMAPPPAPEVAARQYAAWVAAHRAWFGG